MASSPDRILLVGALRAETLPLLRWLSSPRVVSRRLTVGRRGGAALGVLCCGVGPENAQQRTAAALAAWPAAVVISVGTCGALVDGLAVGSVLSADAVMRGAARIPIAPLAGLGQATVVTVDAPVMDPESRRRWATAGAELCEMEADGVRLAARGARFHAVKVVSDLAGASGPEILNRVSLLKFQALALRLVESRLMPALSGALAGR